MGTFSSSLFLSYVLAGILLYGPIVLTSHEHLFTLNSFSLRKGRVHDSVPLIVVNTECWGYLFFYWVSLWAYGFYMQQFAMGPFIISSTLFDSFPPFWYKKSLEILWSRSSSSSLQRSPCSFWRGMVFRSHNLGARTAHCHEAVIASKPF